MIDHRSSAPWLVLILAVALDLGVPFLLGLGYPGYHPLYHTISDLGTAHCPLALPARLNLLIVGSLFIAFSRMQAARCRLSSRAGQWYSFHLLLYGFTCILAGIFPADPLGIPESWLGKTHGITSAIGFLALIANPLIARTFYHRARLRLFNVLLFVAGVLTFGAFIVSGFYQEGLFQYAGLWQRLNLMVLYGAVLLNFYWLQPADYTQK